MYKIIPILFLFFIVPDTEAQILPKEGSKLNYRIIGFTFPVGHEASKYKIEIASGNYNMEDSFKKNIIVSFSGDANRIIGEVPSFGKEYTWRTVFINSDPSRANKKIIQTKSELHHFSTLIVPEVDSKINRLRIIKHAKKYKDAYVFLDNLKTLYDMNGAPVWFLPDSLPDIHGKIVNPQDLKMSQYGTITFLLYSGIYEINYNCDVLWKGPEVKRKQAKKNGIRNVEYHHEFTRLANGHYMALGTQNLLCKLPSLADSSFVLAADDSIDMNNDTSYQDIVFGILTEYDEKGNVVWMHLSSKYIKESDLSYAIKKRIVSPHLHENAFFFDEQNKTIYISFRDISRVIKVKYPEGSILNTYGEIYKPGVEGKRNSLFCRQHACRLSREGYLYLYNNNDCDTGALSRIVMMQEPIYPEDTLKKIWEYECTMNDDRRIHTMDSLKQGGGNVIELPDSSMFACMGYGYSKVFIVSMDKKITWSAIAEKWNADEKKWDMHPSYRASIIINRKELEHLIWNEKIK